MVRARAMVYRYLSQKPSSEDGQFRVSVLVVAWEALSRLLMPGPEDREMISLGSSFILFYRLGRMASGTARRTVATP